METENSEFLAAAGHLRLEILSVSSTSEIRQQDDWLVGKLIKSSTLLRDIKQSLDTALVLYCRRSRISLQSLKPDFLEKEKDGKLAVVLTVRRESVIALDLFRDVGKFVSDFAAFYESYILGNSSESEEPTSDEIATIPPKSNPGERATARLPPARLPTEMTLSQLVGGGNTSEKCLVLPKRTPELRTAAHNKTVMTSVFITGYETTKREIYFTQSSSWKNLRAAQVSVTLLDRMCKEIGLGVQKEVELSGMVENSDDDILDARDLRLLRIMD